ncbi:MAG: glycosyltransferase family 39 protein [bacterium]|nr:glycosyltransferase family 39 protein [bacterium]
MVLRSFFRKHWYEISLFAILLLSVALRFYDFSNRFGLAYDQARDVIVAREALRAFTIPMIGPFASAGPFVYGPQWYWLLMLFVAVSPGALITPWIVQDLLYVLSVFVMVLIGKEISGKTFGLLLGLLFSVSVGQVAQSVNLSSPSMVGIVAVYCVYVAVLFLKKENPIFAGLLGFLIGNAINIHFQAIGLIFLGISSLLIIRKNRFRSVGYFLIGFLIPFIPLFLFDINNNFFESKNILEYYLHGQYVTALPKRWLTYAFVFWPDAWARIVGGYLYFSYPLIVFLGIITIYHLWKRSISRVIVSLLLFFAVEIVLLRYYTGPLYHSYLSTLHPVIVLFSGWALYQLIKMRKRIGMLVTLILICGSLLLNINEIRNSSNNTARQAEAKRKLLLAVYPERKFAVYDYGYNSTANSLPLVLYLQVNGEISDDGYKIGFGSTTGVKKQIHNEISGNLSGFRLRDLNSSSSAELSKEGWAFVNPSIVYHSTVRWYEDKNSE